MSKYNSELKLKIVKDIMKNKMSLSATSNKYNVNENSIKYWLRKYKEHGVKGLIKNIQKYDGNFKLNVIKYMYENHLSLTETAIKYNIANHVIVGKWERIYYEKGPQALFEERRGRKNMSSKPSKKNLAKDVKEDVIDELQRLRIENAYLKKLNALVQERIQRENPKKQKPSAN